MIEQFKIGRDFTISQERQHTIIVEGKETTSTNDENFGWSIDISNLYTKDMKKVLNESNLKSPNDSQLKRFIILNFHGIYNFEIEGLKLNEKLRELKNWYTSESTDWMERLLPYIYNNYFLVAQYKNGVQSLEVYDLEKMELETDARLVENIVNQYNNYETFSVSRLQLCFTQVNIVNLFQMENGLQIASKKFNEIERIYLLEFIDGDDRLLIIGEGLKEGNDLEKELKFIVWDLYDTGKYELTELDDFLITNVENIHTRLARTSGNIIQIDNYGNVSSILKEVKKGLEKKDKKKKAEKEELNKAACPNINLKKDIGKKPNGKPDENHTIYYDKNINFKPIVNDREPWVLGNCERNSYCLYQNKLETETESLQLIVGRSTVQVWHQIQDSRKNKDDLPNKGEPFLEYIWTNRIPINQEREKTRLRVEAFNYESNEGSQIIDFYLKVYWYERNDNKAFKKNEHEIVIDEDKEIDEIEFKKKKINDSVKVKRKEKVIKRQDIIEKFHAVRHACKTLEHLNKRYKCKYLADNYGKIHKYEEMVTYIEHIIRIFAKYEPENFRLLDVRHNLMKSLILGDCDRLIKFILFGDKEGASENDIAYNELRHIPCNRIWPGKKFLKDDDLDFGEKKDYTLIDNEKIKPENNMELAIYHCKGRELKDTIVVAYFLEYYSRNATDNAGWMCTTIMSENYLLENVLYQNHFSGQDPDEIIPNEHLKSRNHSIKFRAFRPMIKNLEINEINKLECYNFWIWIPFKSLKDYIFEKVENYDNVLGKSPLALRVVPLPGFTINDIPKVPKVPKEYSLSIIFSITIMSLTLKHFQISDGFGSAKEVDTGLTVSISFSIFLLWVELIMYLRLISDSTYSGKATNSLTNETLDIELKSDFDPTSSDNPFTSFFTAIEAAYFWINGDWVQRDEFDFWVIDVYTFISSLFLVIVLQNILIAFMSGAYEKAEANGKQTLLRNRANHIADYEALYHINFRNPEPEPNYIYYFGQAKYFEEWYNTRKDDDKSAIYEGFEEISIFTRHFKNVSNEFSNNIEYLIKRNEGKSSIDEFEEICEVKNTLEIEVKKFQLKLEKLRDLTES
uniref:Ion transport domain-containing protein n=1 Tax=Rhizophagus irregularis (strain DAOM 181602 / DAOM 197198 / MUCL 43194) TaxID=747089 RepID=U9SUV0_RHIID